MTLALACLSAAIWAYLVLAHGRFWQAGPMLAPAVPRVAPAVTVVVPARDEAEGIGRCLRSLLAQEYAGALDVVVVDDGSSDGTGAIARGFGDARLRVIEGAARPAGWSGKLWAVSQGVAAAGGEVLLLSDADIEHDPAHVATLVARMERGGLDLVSEMVALRCESVAERLLVPAFVFFFQLLYPFARSNDPRSRVAAAAGGTVLLRASALRAAGGIAAMRGALIDDVTLAGLMKRRAGSGGSGWGTAGWRARSARIRGQRTCGGWWRGRRTCSCATRRCCWRGRWGGWCWCGWCRRRWRCSGMGRRGGWGVAGLGGGDDGVLWADAAAVRGDRCRGRRCCRRRRGSTRRRRWARRWTTTGGAARCGSGGRTRRRGLEGAGEEGEGLCPSIPPGGSASWTSAGD